MQPRFDVIITGGGPAGATAAFYLGEAGRNVLLLEKEIMPRYKTCGGAVSTRALEQFPFSFEEVIQSNASSISYAYGEKLVTIPFKSPTLSLVMRSDFDAYLLGHAKVETQQGSEVAHIHESDENVTVETVEGERFEAEYLIGADGANSITARELGLRQHRVLAGGIEIEAGACEETLKHFADSPLLIFGGLGIGYGWIFPKADHLSIGVGALNPQPGDLQKVLERIARRYGIEIDGQPRHGHPIPMYSRSEKLGTNRCLLTGDAAGLVDPVTGEGIRFAIKSGRIAAEAIIKGALADYSARVDACIGRSHRIGIAFRNIFYKYPQGVLKYALGNPAFSEGAVDMLADRIGYGRLLLKFARSTPGFLLKKKGKTFSPR